MIAELGHFALILAFAVALALGARAGINYRENADWDERVATHLADRFRQDSGRVLLGLTALAFTFTGYIFGSEDATLADSPDWTFVATTFTPVAACPGGPPCRTSSITRSVGASSQRKRSWRSRRASGPVFVPLGAKLVIACSPTS